MPPALTLPSSADSLGALASELVHPPDLADPLPLSLAHRQQGVSHEGGLSSLSCFVSKLRAGRNVTMAVLGGSVSAGSSSRVRPDQGGLYHRKLHRWLQRRWPRANIRHINAAMPAVPPGYMEQCLSLHVPPNVDLVLLEASANMCGGALGMSASSTSSSSSSGGGGGGGAADAVCDAGRESVERMLRQVLRFRPGLPAVVFVHAFPFWTMRTPKSWYMAYAPHGAAPTRHTRRAPRGRRGGRSLPSTPLSRVEDLDFGFHTQWGHTANEDLLETLAKYYDLPSVSLRTII